MKKFIAAAAAVALTFAMAVPAFATGYNADQDNVVDVPGQDTQVPGEDTQVPGVDNTSKVIAVDGTTTVTEYEATEAKALEQAALADANVQAAVAGKDVTIIGTYDLTGTPGAVVVAVEYVLGEGEKLVAFHQLADGTWEVLDCKDLGNGTYEMNVNSFSAFVFAAVKEAAAKTPAGSTTGTTSAVASPKTGDAGALAVIKACA